MVKDWGDFIMRKKLNVLFIAAIACFLISGCSEKETPGDPDKLAKYLSEYEAAYEEENGDLTDGSIQGYLKQVQIDAASSREYDIKSIDQDGNTLVFTLAGDVTYSYVPDGFDGDTDNDTISDGDDTGIIIDSDIPYPVDIQSENSTDDTVVDDDASTDEDLDLGEYIDANDYSEEELQELVRRQKESESIRNSGANDEE